MKYNITNVTPGENEGKVVATVTARGAIDAVRKYNAQTVEQYTMIGERLYQLHGEGHILRAIRVKKEAGVILTTEQINILLIGLIVLRDRKKSVLNMDDERWQESIRAEIAAIDELSALLKEAKKQKEEDSAKTQ